jgi:hypothetical protein
MRNFDESRKFEQEPVEREPIAKEPVGKDIRGKEPIGKEPILKEPNEKQGEVVSFEQRTPSTPVQQGPLLPKSEVDQFQSRWQSIQAGFVDEPRKTLEEADKFCASVTERISHLYSDERGKMEGTWRRGDHVSTEDLRMALQRYRAFFSRLMSM